MSASKTDQNTTVERVLCVAADQLPKFNGLLYHADQYISPRFINLWGMYLDRSRVEKDETWKQLIPFVIVTTTDGEVFRYTRKGSEARLHGLFSIGVGGHVKENESISGAAIRELHEEMGVSGSMNWLALVNDEETLVSRVHLGVVMIVVVDKKKVRLSDETLNGQFLPKSVVCSTDLSFYENWSRHVMPIILREL